MIIGTITRAKENELNTKERKYDSCDGGETFTAECTSPNECSKQQQAKSGFNMMLVAQMNNRKRLFKNMQAGLLHVAR